MIQIKEGVPVEFGTPSLFVVNPSTLTTPICHDDMVHKL